MLLYLLCLRLYSLSEIKRWFWRRRSRLFLTNNITFYIDIDLKSIKFIFSLLLSHLSFTWRIGFHNIYKIGFISVISLLYYFRTLCFLRDGIQLWLRLIHYTLLIIRVRIWHFALDHHSFKLKVWRIGNRFCKGFKRW